MIRYEEQEKAFYLDNGRITYCFGIVKGQYLESRYFGRKIRRCRGSARPWYFDRGFCSNPDPEDKIFSLDTLPQEYPCMNQGDFASRRLFCRRRTAAGYPGLSTGTMPFCPASRR